jgi:hypothetical protein
MSNEVLLTDARDPVSIRQVTTGLRLLAFLTFLLIAFKIASYGYLPPGDARRHAALAVSGKAYTDVLILRPEYKFDHSPGWDALLSYLHGHAGFTEDALCMFSIVVLSFFLTIAPLPWLRCPEAWLMTFMAFALAVPGTMGRFVQGRPYEISEAILICLLMTWVKVRPASWLKIVLSALGFALSTWMHGAWYLWGVLPLAFVLAGRWRDAISLALCWISGALLGASLTGHPLEFLGQAVAIARLIAGEHAMTTSLVQEFQPSLGDYTIIMIMAVMFVWRRKRVQDVIHSPVLWMAVLGWMLGLAVLRYWLDWGIPAAMVWLALEFDEVLVQTWSNLCRQRLLVSGVVALSVYLATTSDGGGRWTENLRQTFLDGSDPEIKTWMPGEGGIFYHADMVFFYDTFYKNPHGDWRYILGFEPALMPPDDLKVYRSIQQNNFSWQEYKPWVDKMRPEDRLEITGGTRPIMPPLEFLKVGNMWIGRLPRIPRAK